MRKRSIASLLCMTSVLFLCGTVFGDSRQFAISPSVGTLGLGGELTTRVTSNVNARIGVHAFSFDFDGTESDIEYNVDVDLLSFTGLLDWHVFDDSFRITGGILLNESEVDMRARPATPLTIGGTSYTAAQAGTVSGSLDFDDVVPYVGIGWGNPFRSEQGLSLALDLGVVFMGSPDVSLSANGTLASDQAFQAELAKERQDIEDEWSDFKYYPVLSLNLFYRF